MESAQGLAITSPHATPISAPHATPNTFGNWGDTYDPFGPSMLNPHNVGATAIEGNVDMAQISVPFTSFGSFG